MFNLGFYCSYEMLNRIETRAVESDGQNTNSTICNEISNLCRFMDGWVISDNNRNTVNLVEYINLCSKDLIIEPLDLCWCKSIHRGHNTVYSFLGEGNNGTSRKWVFCLFDKTLFSSTCSSSWMRNVWRKLKIRLNRLIQYLLNQ